ncbi:family 43 glycosylhydrolase [Sphingomonas sp. KR1UV-12]|uniref:Family 43 glycosylhydrolase n=1 Tax=Sphingomonas aurea TaxID=3063994 RepID=A0ABT9EK82_9SPHN|nr:family 43 glycosylhydrolase [Sphingomonas sp. KR1UV-12]MDP1027023.1 family 43 glycosylhydrolase [Sphingomonas sp. KR1UV-12]
MRRSDIARLAWLLPLAVIAPAMTVTAPARPAAAARAQAVARAIAADPVWRAPIRGSVTLADTGAGAAAIRWRSSDPSLLSDTDRHVGSDLIRKGTATRGATDKAVRLTATVLVPGAAPVTVPLALTVAAAPAAAREEKQAYLFVYFTGDSVEGEKLRFAVSDGNNALQWKELNGAQPILESAFGTRGLRDPFVLRSAEGDRFFLLATDLSVGRSGWGEATSHGSAHLEIWGSTDLVHWGKQRHVRVNTPDAGMTWAPEASYDPAIQAYVVYWTSSLYRDAAHKMGDGNGPQILMSTTRDFRTFTKPEPWFKSVDVPGLVRDKGMIDATVLKDGDDYYRFTKVTQAQGCASPDIIGQRTTVLRAPGASPQWTVVASCIGRDAGTPEVEGPSAFIANPGDVSGFRYYLWVDNYGGVGYIPLATNSLKGKIRWTYPAKFRLPVSPRHGSVLSITAKERDALVARWGTAPAAPLASANPAQVGDAWVVPPVLASGTRLPAPAGARVLWMADGAGLEGDFVINANVRPVTLRLTGTAALPAGGSIAKTFTVQVLGQSNQRLTAYARTPTDAHDANQPMIARSVHLALGDGSAAPRPLNDDYGVLFASGDYTGVDRVSLRGVADPSPFYFADGSLGVIGTRVQMSGAPDPSLADTVIVFKAKAGSPADFVELGTVDLRTKGGVTVPSAVWDSAAKRYVVAWTDRTGNPRWTTVSDLARTERVATPYYPLDGGRRSRIISDGNVGVMRMGSVATGNVTSGLPVSNEVATALQQRFGRVVNTAAAVDARTIAPGDIAAVRASRVRLTYSDGSIATRGVDWNPADLGRLSKARSGTYVIHGTVRLPDYPQIFAYNRADPDIFRYDHAGRTRYLFIATDDDGNDNVGSAHLPLRVADSIDALADDNGGRAREVDLLNRRTRRDRTVEGRVIAGCYWAPELHEIGGRLTILFAPCFNPNDDQSNEKGSWSTVQSHMIQLREGGDPANPADWSRAAAIRKADGSPLGRAAFPKNISLDMSYFEIGGQGYYTWSQRYLPATGTLGDPLTWIAKVDPAAPSRLTSEPRPIIAPDLSFEENLSEGAFALFHDGRVHLVYSGSGVSPTYVVGGVWADAQTDLTDIDSWHKYGAPLQKSEPMPAGVTDYRRYEQGPGHGAFTTDADGNVLYVYHSWGNGVGGDGRDARVRRIHWAADGRPLLDMRAEEEVALAKRKVTMAVTVRRAASNQMHLPARRAR